MHTKYTSPLNFIAYILIVLALTISIIIFLVMNPQYWGSIEIAIVISIALVVIILTLALIPMLPLTLLLVSSIMIIVLLSRHWFEPLPQLTAIINRVFMGSVVTVLVFALIWFAVHQRYCIEPFLREELEMPPIEFKKFLEKPTSHLISLEIAELIIIIALIAIFEPRISQIIGDALPGLGMQDLMEFYPIRNLLVTIGAVFGIVTSFKDQINYINIMRNRIMNECYNNYKRRLYRKLELENTLDDKSICILKILSSLHFDDVYSLCSRAYNECRTDYNDCSIRMEVLCNNDIINNTIRELFENDVFVDPFCKDYMYLSLAKICIKGLKITNETLSIAINKCAKGKLLKKVKAYISLAPLIILPIIIAIL